MTEASARTEQPFEKSRNNKVFPSKFEFNTADTQANKNNDEEDEEGYKQMEKQIELIREMYRIKEEA